MWYWRFYHQFSLTTSAPPKNKHRTGNIETYIRNQKYKNRIEVLPSWNVSTATIFKRIRETASSYHVIRLVVCSNGNKVFTIKMRTEWQTECHYFCSISRFLSFLTQFHLLSYFLPLLVDSNHSLPEIRNIPSGLRWMCGNPQFVWF